MGKKRRKKSEWEEENGEGYDVVDDDGDGGGCTLQGRSTISTPRKQNRHNLFPLILFPLLLLLLLLLPPPSPPFIPLTCTHRAGMTSIY